MNAAKKYFGRKATSDEMERAYRERAGQDIFWIKVDGLREMNRRP